MTNTIYLAKFDVKGVPITDLISGCENLIDIQFIGAVGAQLYSDIWGSDNGWAGLFLFNEKAKTSLYNFLDKENTL